MRARQYAGRAEAHPRGEQRHVEAELSQHPGKERVLLEAISAASGADELFLQAVEVDPDRTPEEDVEILEWDVRHMRDVQGPQRRECRLDAPAVANACEIGV